MRIRKNTKVSSLLPPHASAQTHVCQLNQSPWDVIPFASSSHHHQQDPLLLFYPHSSSSSSPHLQFELEESFNGNGSLGDSIGAVESVASMEKLDFMAVDDNREITDQKQINGVEEPETTTDRFRLSTKGKPYKSNSSTLKSSGVKRAEKPSPTPAPARRGRPRGAQGTKRVSVSESNPYEFYYYSGFGPRWGKRRGGGGIEGGDGSVRNGDGGNGSAEVKTASCDLGLEKGVDGGIDYVEDEDEEEEEGDGSGGSRRRTRKPVKARSLKSLM